YKADAGEIFISGKKTDIPDSQAAIAAGIGMVFQHFKLAENFTVLENIILGAEDGRLLKPSLSKARKTLISLAEDYGLNVDPDALIQDIGVGMQQRVEILKALYREAKILILDEPTAVLTPQQIDGLFETLRLLLYRGLAVIFISHKMPDVMTISDRVIVLRHGRVVFEGETGQTTEESLAVAMVGHTIPTSKRGIMEKGESLLSLKGVTVTDEGGKRCLDDLSLTIPAHRILGIAGVSGNGQAELADVVSGLIQPDKGEVILHGKRIERVSPNTMIKQGVGRIPEDRQSVGIIGEMTVLENLASEVYRDKPFSRLGILNFHSLRENAQRLVQTFDIRCRDVTTTARKLSGGNMQKLILARVLSRSPSVILANQPSWGLDVGAIAYVHKQLLAARTRGAGVLLISEDLDELLQLSDYIQVLYRGRLSEPMKVEDVSLADLGLLMAGQKQTTFRPV
ncbi:hypothetical protein LCGC14_1255040, partial [marine sediment metagenome]